MLAVGQPAIQVDVDHAHQVIHFMLDEMVRSGDDLVINGDVALGLQLVTSFWTLAPGTTSFISQSTIMPLDGLGARKVKSSMFAGKATSWPEATGVTIAMTGGRRH